jgi:hypothetical protein
VMVAPGPSWAKRPRTHGELTGLCVGQVPDM